jgi:hypothetical protein
MTIPLADLSILRTDPFPTPSSTDRFPVATKIFTDENYPPGSRFRQPEVNLN